MATPFLLFIWKRKFPSIVFWGIAGCQNNCGHSGCQRNVSTYKSNGIVRANGSEMYLIPNRKPLVIADKGWSGAFEEIVKRLHCKIPKTGKVFETSKSSDQ